jgi:hypothetical protein
MQRYVVLRSAIDADADATPQHQHCCYTMRTANPFLRTSHQQDKAFMSRKALLSFLSLKATLAVSSPLHLFLLSFD